MKLLVIASTYPRWPNDHEPGFVHELSKRLTDDFDVTVLCPHSPGAATVEKMDGVQVIRYRYAPEKLELLINNGGIVNNLAVRPWLWLVLPVFFLCQFGALVRVNRRLKADVIHAHWVIPQGLILAIMSVLRFRLPPYLLTSHGGDLSALKGRVFRSLKLFAISRAAAFTVVSEAMREKAICMGVDAKKVQVRSMGVDLLRRFTPSPEPSTSPPTVLFVGRLVEKKGANLLIRAIPQIREVFPDIRVNIVGYGPEEKSLRELADTLGVSQVTRFCGAKNQSEVAAYYQKASVLAAPFVRARSGDEDGLGLVIAEALASGCPVVTSDLPATRDVVHGLSGAKTVSSGSVSSLAEALIEVLGAPAFWKAKVRGERSLIVEKLDWQFVSREYVCYLKRLINL